MKNLGSCLKIHFFVAMMRKKKLKSALHIAVSTLHHVDFLLTWNCRHIANPVIQEKIAVYLEQFGLFLPIVCTPEELLGGNTDD